MTWKEKLQKEKPEYISPLYMGGCSGCPGTHFNEARDIRVSFKGCPALNHRSNEDSCAKCWNSEIPGTETKNKENDMGTFKPIAREILTINDIQNLGSRLSAYEDIGLDPEELKELVKKYIPKPAIVEKITSFDSSSKRSCRRTANYFSCPECGKLLVTHIHLEILDEDDGYSIQNECSPTSDGRCHHCGQLVTFKKEENANG